MNVGSRQLERKLVTVIHYSKSKSLFHYSSPKKHIILLFQEQNFPYSYSIIPLQPPTVQPAEFEVHFAHFIFPVRLLRCAPEFLVNFYLLVKNFVLGLSLGRFGFEHFKLKRHNEK